MNVDLAGRVALVTGASRGRGVALGLARTGATVFATGRSIQQTTFDVDVTTVVCDYANRGVRFQRR